MTRGGVALALLLLAGCATVGPGDGPPARERAVTPTARAPGPEPLSAYGNPRFYEVRGHRYYVSHSATGYRERGVASWYGRKFHGRKTSSGEIYDMHAMTAAHKTLPLPTWARVTNLSSGRSIVVRINDRGPFVDNRLIDLSYAAARALDLVEAGTGLVEVTALSFEEPADIETTTVAAESQPLYMQVGAFAEHDNARRRLAQLANAGIDGAFVARGDTGRGAVYRVRIGPIGGVEAYDRLTAALHGAGITDVRLVSETVAGTR